MSAREPPTLSGVPAAGEYVRLPTRRPVRPATHCQRDPAAAVHRTGRLPTWSAAAPAVFREQPVHQFFAFAFAFYTIERQHRHERSRAVEPRRRLAWWPATSGEFRDIDVDIGESPQLALDREVRQRTWSSRYDVNGSDGTPSLPAKTPPGCTRYALGEGAGPAVGRWATWCSITTTDVK